MVKAISLIIPFKSEKNKLIILLGEIPNWKVAPNEIIIINTDQKQLSFPNDIEFFAKQHNINIRILHREGLYPGHARNIGISNASNPLLAFLDTSTYPCNDWLSNGLSVLGSYNYQGIWGKTYYQAENFLPKIFRAATYGENPIKTLPGSILHKNIFKKCGLFVESTRAGEDGDFMGRVELHNINMCQSEIFLSYDKLNQMSFVEIIKKWYRNHFNAARLPFFRAHKDIYFYCISFAAIVIAYNWNRVFDPTGLENSLFIPNITKISILLFFCAYVFLRGIYLPMRKGVSLKFIFLFNFIFIAFCSGLLDFSKILAFTKAKFSNKQK